VDALTCSPIPVNLPIPLQRLAWSYATNMCSVAVQAIGAMTASGTISRLSCCRPRDYRRSTFTPRPDTMPRPSRFFASILPLWLLMAGAGRAQTPAQAAPQPAAQAAAGQAAQSSGDPLDEPLTPDELVVPSNKALEAVAPMPAAPTAPSPNTTATAPAPGAPAGKPGAGGELQQRGKSGVFTLRAEVDEVVLHATVVDDRQRLVTNLDRNAFTVFENGQAEPITSFRHEDVPVAVGILVDDSASMRDKRPAVSQAALNFVRSSNPDDRV